MWVFGEACTGTTNEIAYGLFPCKRGDKFTRAGSACAIFSAYVSAKAVGLHVVTVSGYCHIVEMIISG
jgi:hypothetical protein